MKIKFLALLASCLVATSTNAELIRYQFSGSVFDINTVNSPIPASINLSSSVSGSMTFDTSAMPITPPGSVTIWTSALVDFSITVGDYTISFDTTPNTLNTNSIWLGPDFNRFEGIHDANSNESDSFSATRFAYVALDFDQIAFAEPEIPISFDGVDQITGSVAFDSSNPDFGTVSVVFNISSIEVMPVPIPGAVFLFVSALMTFGLRKR